MINKGLKAMPIMDSFCYKLIHTSFFADYDHNNNFQELYGFKNFVLFSVFY